LTALPLVATLTAKRILDEIFRLSRYSIIVSITGANMKGLFGTILTTFLLGMPLTAQSIIVTSPNGGETWPLGTSHDITWSATSYSGTVNLMLFNGGAQVGAIATGLSAATGR
jgi:hypothetical protein